MNIERIERKSNGKRFSFTVHFDNGQSAECAAGNLMSYRKFQTAVLEKTGQMCVVPQVDHQASRESEVESSWRRHLYWLFSCRTQ